MNNSAVPRAASPASIPLTAGQAKRYAVTAWYLLATMGHFIFATYILAVFYPPIAAHGAEGLAGMHLPNGFREGDVVGNLAAVTHVMIAVVVIAGGPLQLMPIIRSRLPAFHRVLGRCYVMAAMCSATVGLYMVWTRGTVGGLVGHIAISGDGILILIFSALTVYNALKGRLATHRRWAMRLFMVASSVWFFRVGLMGWIALTGGMGIDFKTFSGPALTLLFFAQYLLPLAMLEWYFRLQRPAPPAEQWGFALVVMGLSSFMAVGIFSATIDMWLPRV
ncbi:DUF2306 domain-containing protein [Congregibacter variabilis]|uniref:DUF2306 domain-containing protein n=1 Tax=Congregibacter variabilis TaxID=3081200 RepID=A0ABZ0I071_9GAMM|nr:DUF2306 domain-containing protein [Congregibacter sp. IMCC43200]